MRCGRRVTRLLAGVGILTIGFASVAQAAGVDRKAYRAARESCSNLRERAGKPWIGFRGRPEFFATVVRAAASCRCLVGLGV